MKESTEGVEEGATTAMDYENNSARIEKMEKTGDK